MHEWFKQHSKVYELHPKYNPNDRYIRQERAQKKYNIGLNTLIKYKGLAYGLPYLKLDGALIFAVAPLEKFAKNFKENIEWKRRLWRTKLTNGVMENLVYGKTAWQEDSAERAHLEGLEKLKKEGIDEGKVPVEVQPQKPVDFYGLYCQLKEITARLNRCDIFIDRFAIQAVQLKDITQMLCHHEEKNRGILGAAKILWQRLVGA